MTTSAEQRLSQRELRNESARVLRSVAAGQSFVVTNAGVPVGRLLPLEAEPASTLRLRPAKRKGGWGALAETAPAGGPSVAELLDALREDRS